MRQARHEDPKSFARSGEACCLASSLRRCSSPRAVPRDQRQHRRTPASRQSPARPSREARSRPRTAPGRAPHRSRISIAGFAATPRAGASTASTAPPSRARRGKLCAHRGGRRPPDPLPGDRHEPGWNGELQLQRDESRQGQRRRAEERATADDLWHSGGEQHPDRQQGHLDRRPDDRVRVSVAPLRHTRRQLFLDQRRDREHVPAQVRQHRHHRTHPRHGHEQSGSAAATSAPTAVVTKAQAPAGSAISINDVALPNRSSSTNTHSNDRLRKHGRLNVRVHVSDSRNHSVVGARLHRRSPARAGIAEPRRAADRA